MKTYRTDFEYVNGQPFPIVFLSDIHWGAAACDEDGLINDIKKYKDDWYFLLLGDQQNSIWVKDDRFTFSELNPRYLGNDGFLDNIVDDLSSVFTQYIPKEKILGAVEGNHEYKNLIMTNRSLHQTFCKNIGTTQLPYECAYQIHFSHKSGGGVRILNLHLHHGFGAGQNRDTPVPPRYVKKMDDIEADIHALAHIHTKGTVMKPKEYINTGGTLGTYVKNRYVIVCGTYMKTGSNTENVTWAQRMGFPLRAIGNMRAVITPRSDKPRLEIDIIE
jgi:hypothetical protein